jgi:hypothetical protein
VAQLQQRGGTATRRLDRAKAVTALVWESRRGGGARLGAAALGHGGARGEGWRRGEDKVRRMLGGAAEDKARVRRRSAKRREGARARSGGVRWKSSGEGEKQIKNEKVI